MSAHLKHAETIVRVQGALTFEKDVHDLIRELSDPLRELDELPLAETHLRQALARDDQTNSRSRPAVMLCLAKNMFAQQRFQEAEQLCLNIQS